MKVRAAFVIVSFAAMTIATLAVKALPAAVGSELDAELRELDAMRAGTKTPVDLVESRGKALLEKYSEPEEQGLIYYQLAHVHAQSGQVRPDLVVLHSEEGLKRPLPREKRLQLYIYCGDAFQIMNSGRSSKGKPSFVKARKKAAEVYLMGLKDSAAFNLPKEKPEITGRAPIQMPLGDASDPEFHRKVAEIRKQNEEYAAQLEQTRRDQEAWENRRILYDQIVYMYLRDPADDEEFKNLANEWLPADMAAQLFDRFQEKSGMRQKPLEVVADASSTASPEISKRGINVAWLVGANLIAVLIVGGVLVYRNRSQKT